MLGDLEKTFSVIWRKHVWRFEENIFGDLEKLVRQKRWRFGEKWSAQLWRLRIGVRYEVAWSSVTTSGC